MARIYEQRVQATPYPGRRQQLSDEVADAQIGVAKGVERLGTAVGGAVDQIGQRLVQEQHDAAIQEAYSNLGAVGDNLHAGLLNKKGKAAAEDRDNILRQWDERAQQVGEEIAPPARRAYKALVQQERAKFQRGVDAYVGQEARAYTAQVHEAALDTAQSQALAAAVRGDPTGMLEAVKTAHQVIDAGNDPDEVKALKKAAATTGGHLAVVDGIIDRGNTTLARQYLELHRPLLDEALVAKSGIEAKLARADVRADGYAIARRLYQGNSRELGKALAALEADESITVEKRAEAREQIRAMADDDLQSSQAQNREPLAQLRELMFTGRPVSMNHKLVDQLDQLGRTQWAEDLARERARRGELGAKARQEQRERDRDFKASFTGLRLIGEQGADKLTVDLDQLGKRYGASQAAVNEVRGAQGNLDRQNQQDNGVSAKAFDDQVEQQLEQLEVDDDYKKSIRKWVNGFYSRWRAGQKDPTIPPPQAVVDQWFGDWWVNGEEDVGGVYDEDLLGIEAAMRGTAFVTDEGRRVEGSTYAAGATGPQASPAAAPAAQAAPAGQVAIIGPKGQRKLGPGGPELDAWLAAHPDWRRE